jgi:hypothetical protein
MRTLATAFVLTLSPAVAMAQGISFEGATLGLDINHNSTFNYSEGELEGSVELGFGPAFSVQLDLALWDYDGADSDDFYGYGLHGIYDIGTATSVGLFYSQDTWNLDTYDYVGIEGKHVFGAGGARPLTVEAFYGDYTEQDSSPYEISIAGLDVDWAVGAGFSVNGKVLSVSGDDNVTILGIGGEYALAQGPRVGLGYQHQDHDSFEQDVWSLSLAYDLQGGVTFKQRKWVDALPAY